MDELAKHFAELADKYGPQVADAAKAAARVEAYSCLMSGVVSIGVGIGLALVVKDLWRKRQNDDWDEMMMIIPILLFAIGSAICILVGAWNWIDPWTWTTLSHPELWLAKKAFHL